MNKSNGLPQSPFTLRIKNEKNYKKNYKKLLFHEDWNNFTNNSPDIYYWDPNSSRK